MKLLKVEDIEERKVEYSLSIYDAPGMPRIKA